MDIWLSTEIENTKKSLLETYELMEKYAKEGLEDCKDKNTLLQQMKVLCEIKHEDSLREQALKVAREHNTVEEFEQAYENTFIKGTNKKFDARKLKEYREFSKRLQELSETCDANASDPSTNGNANETVDDIIMEDVATNVLDPLTKKPMKNPVRNKHCGHHYEKVTILEAIKQAPKLRCPVAGCGNKHVVIASNLIEDISMKKRIQRNQQAEEEDSSSE